MDSFDYREETYLTPGGTRIRFEAWVVDYKYLFKPMHLTLSRDEYTAILQIADSADYHRFMELGERCIMEVEMKRHPRGNKIPKKAYEHKKGYVIASQLFPPRINFTEEKINLLKWEKASIAGHFRDGPDGSIYFQLDYVDVVEPVYEDTAPVNNQDVDDDDW